MDFNRKTRTRNIQGKNLNVNNYDDLQRVYPYCVQFYNVPPTEVIRLEEFEELAIERLNVLKSIEYVGMKHFKLNFQTYRDAITKELTRLNLISYIRSNSLNTLDKTYEERRRDHISHFILRLAYCRTEELRRWFLQQECDLLRVRLIDNSFCMTQVLEHNNMHYKAIDDSEFERLMVKIDNTLDEPKPLKKGASVYKIYFTDILDLVQTGAVYLEKGYAYVTDEQLVSAIVNIFRTKLSRELAITARAIPQMEEDGRLLKLLGNINEVYLGKDYGKLELSKSGEVVPAMIDSLSKSSFPLCMRMLHESFRTNHHLRHGGRMQYGLFLKAIGMKLEDALRFWREEFTKKIGIDDFDKQYAYNIRHNYGKEGIRKNYSSYSCVKIITGNSPAAGEAHGCPFKHMDKGNLSAKLRSLNISTHGIKDIVELCTNGHYQIACTQFFELSHSSSNGVTLHQAINHPVEYYEESKKIRNGTVTDVRKNQLVKPNPPSVEVETTPVEIKLPNDNVNSMGLDMEMFKDEMDFGDI